MEPVNLNWSHLWVCSETFVVDGDAVNQDHVIVKVVIGAVVVIIMVFIPGLLLYDCALKLAAHFLSKHCLIRTLAKSTTGLALLPRQSPQAYSWLIAAHLAEQRKGSHKLTNQPSE